MSAAEHPLVPQIRTALHQVNDPEIRRPITDLGMVDTVSVEADGTVKVLVEGKQRARVRKNRRWVDYGYTLYHRARRTVLGLDTYRRGRQDIYAVAPDDRGRGAARDRVRDVGVGGARLGPPWGVLRQQGRPGHDGAALRAAARAARDAGSRS